MYTYCNDDLRNNSSRVVCLKRRVICLPNLHNARCKITLISLSHSESFNINIISKASLFHLNLLLRILSTVCYKIYDNITTYSQRADVTPITPSAVAIDLA